MKCQVTWSNDDGNFKYQMDICKNEATHWASATDASHALFKVCSIHAQFVRDLKYKNICGMRVEGEPLWVCQKIK